MRVRTGTRWPTLLFFSVLAAIATGGCGGPATDVATAPDRFEEVRAHIQTWLWETGDDEVLIPVGEMKETIVDDWASQKERYQILSVRRPEHYAAGHVPNAINVPWPEIVSEGSLEQLDPGKTTVAYCYIGHGSMLACTMLNLLGHRCRSMDAGMMAWNLDALERDPWDREAGHPVETAVNQPAASYRPPTITSERADVREIIRERAERYLSGEGSPVIGSADVKAIIDDWAGRGGDYQIVDVRSREDYEAGHVPHALSVPWKETAQVENLRKLDPARTTILYSENGQTGQLAATALNLLGYPAVAMKFGMMDWNAGQVDESQVWSGAAGYAVETSTQDECVPPSAAVDVAGRDGYKILGLDDPTDNSLWSCGDVNDDGQVDLCAVLVRDERDWKVGCLMSRGDSVKFERIADSTQQGLQKMPPQGLFLDVVRAGTKVSWAQGAADVTLHRDCVRFGTPEASWALYCFNGAYFLEMWESD